MPDGRVLRSIGSPHRALEHNHSGGGQEQRSCLAQHSGHSLSLSLSRDGLASDAQAGGALGR